MSEESRVNQIAMSEFQDTRGMYGHVKYREYGRAQFFDPGDVLHRTSYIGLAEEEYQIFPRSVNCEMVFASCWDGKQLRRYWNKNYGAAKDGTGSRDNIHPFIMWLGVKRRKTLLFTLFWAQLKRGMRFWNYRSIAKGWPIKTTKIFGKEFVTGHITCDFAGVLVWASYWKGFFNDCPKFFFPFYWTVLSIFDIFFCGHVFNRVAQSFYDPEETTDHLNLQAYMRETRIYGGRSKTLPFLFGHWFYFRFVQRARPRGADKRLEGQGWWTQLASYFRVRFFDDGEPKHIPVPIHEIENTYRAGLTIQTYYF